MFKALVQAHAQAKALGMNLGMGLWLKLMARGRAKAREGPRPLLWLKIDFEFLVLGVAWLKQGSRMSVSSLARAPAKAPAQG